MKHKVILIGGSSGTGKSYLARELAKHFDMPVTEVDDIRIALQQLVDKEKYPELFTFVDTPNYLETYTAEEYMQNITNVSLIVWKSLSELITKHIVCNEPIIFEGDSIIPDLVASLSVEGVTSIFVYDDLSGISKKQAMRNRHGVEATAHVNAANFSHAFNDEILRQARKHGYITIPASPSETLVQRVIEVLE